MGRPPKEINWEYAEKMIEAGCSAKDIANKFNIRKIDNFYNSFKKNYGCTFGEYRDKYAQCKVQNILTTQYLKALSGNIPMLTLLGKEWCGQGKNDEIQQSPRQKDIDLEHKCMELEHKVKMLEEKYGHKS